MNYFVYIVTNAHNRVLYIGVTKDLVRRVYEHKHHLDKSSYTSRYNVKKLVYFEVGTDPYYAIQREKQLKAGSREKKIKLINSKNPNWADLYDSIL